MNVFSENENICRVWDIRRRKQIGQLDIAAPINVKITEVLENSDLVLIDLDEGDGDWRLLGLGKEEVARLVPHPTRNTTPAKRKPLRVWRPYFRSGLGLSSVFLFMY